MSAFVGRMRAMGERLPRRGSYGERDSDGDLPPESRPLSRVVSVSVLLMVIAAAGAAVLLTRGHSVGDLLGSSHPVSAVASAEPLTPTRLVALPPHAIVNGTGPLTVTLSAPPAADSPAPTLRPAVAGTWSTVGNSAVFTPASTLMPCSTYTLTVWADTIATGRSRLGKRHTIGLNVACPSTAALQQSLARLGYMGASFHPLYAVHIADGPETRREAAVHMFHPPRGAIVPDPSDAPAVETGRLDETTRGALTVYQSHHGLEPTGEPNYATWASLLAAEAGYRRNPSPYTWVTVSESIPETLEVHRGHHVSLSTPVNTGVPGAETAQGIFPIYSRFESTTMTGTDPDGTKYVAPDVPWVNYFNGGDAVHGYPRASYGTPQSNGCVELPIETAHTVFGMLQLGDIVVVS
ncbi:MAG TPA: L,D-transpeptidase family protein [Solirubrobacteraceae bacterium]|jgi:peptidoglycan hydrolase-like protein with peptidoglycan-binding domain|nr:L,D-transpeptidase family protein [Solirubrobacteraceae bacterium]